MNLLLDSNPGLTVGLIAGGILILILIIFSLSMFFIGRSKKKNAVATLEREHAYLLSLMSEKLAKNIARIELISRTNLLYVEVLEKCREKFQPILANLNGSIAIDIKNLRQDIVEKEYGKINKRINEAKNKLNLIKQDILALEKEIDAIIKPEEEARSEALMVKELFREVKKIYHNDESDLTLVHTSFKNIFDNVNDNFIEIDRLIESAEYVEVRSTIDSLVNLFNELLRILKDLPTICMMITSIIPNKMAHVDSIYEKLEKENFPLRHLRVKGGLTEMEKELESIKTRTIQLDINKSKERLESFNLQLENYLLEFEKEKEAKVEFERIYKTIAEVVDSLHKRYIKLSNNLHEIRRYYQISSDYEARLEEIKMQIDDITSIKRSLDTYVHSSTGQHYSLLVFKAHQLEERAALTEKNLSGFKNYETSLKDDAERAYELMHQVYFKLFELKRKSEYFVAEKQIVYLKQNINACYQIIEALQESLKIIPIDIVKVNNLINQLSFKSSDLEEYLNKEYTLLRLCEINFTHANLYRFQFSEVNRQMVQIENSFWHGDYKSTFEDLSIVLRKQGSQVITTLNEQA